MTNTILNGCKVPDDSVVRASISGTWNVLFMIWRWWVQTPVPAHASPIAFLPSWLHSHQRSAEWPHGVVRYLYVCSLLSAFQDPLCLLQFHTSALSCFPFHPSRCCSRQKVKECPLDLVSCQPGGGFRRRTITVDSSLDHWIWVTCHLLCQI